MKKYITTYLMIYLLFFYVFIFSTNLHAEDKFELTLQESIKKALEVNHDLQTVSPQTTSPQTTSPQTTSPQTTSMTDNIYESQEKEKEKAKGHRNKKETIYRIKTFYYDLLLKNELIKLTKEVKDNFKKAVGKAEKKLEAEDPDITLQDFLKLKLGLVGSKDELNHLEHDRKAIIDSLKIELGIKTNRNFDISIKKLKKEKFELKKIQEYFDLVFSHRSTLKEKETKISITKIYFKIQEAGESIKIAREVRKISRSLLVTNLANFDFGIGEAKDLFESLFIYMRSVKNYLIKIHDYNISIAELSFVTGKELSNLVY